jgi:FkbM family methyltransferase
MEKNNYAFAKVKAGVMALRYVSPFGKFVLDYFGFLNKGNLIYTVRKNKYSTRLKTRDCATIAEVELLAVYQPDDFEIKEHDTVIDIGAHIGTFSVQAAKSAYKGKIYSFEPFPENFSLLQQNLQLNKIENVTPYRTAISDCGGFAPLFISKDNSGGHSLIKNAPAVRNSINSIRVETKALEQIVQENKIKHINFLKMDCEGSEYNILLSTPEGLFKKIDKISVECHNIGKISNKKIVNELLEKRGFDIEFGIENKEVSMLYARKA